MAQQLLSRMLVECPSNTYLAYNGADSVCMELMPATACSGMLAACQAIYGGDSSLLQITTYGVMKDALTALDK